MEGGGRGGMWRVVGGEGCGGGWRGGRWRVGVVVGGCWVLGAEGGKCLRGGRVEGGGMKGIGGLRGSIYGSVHE